MTSAWETSGREVEPGQWKLAAQFIRQFSSGKITTTEFESAYEELVGRDRVLFEISLALWRHYSDTHEHKLIGKNALRPSAAALYERCILFLERQTWYEWPFTSLVGDLKARLASFRKTAKALSLAALPEQGDLSVWPFFRRDDLELAARR